MKILLIISLVIGTVSCSTVSPCDKLSQAELDMRSFEDFSYQAIGYFYTDGDGKPLVSHNCKTLSYDDSIIEEITLAEPKITHEKYLFERCQLNQEFIISVRPKYLEGYVEKDKGACIPERNPKNLPSFQVVRSKDTNNIQINRVAS